MKFSLILATIGRVAEVERFLCALVKQTYHDFELIIVDQNNEAFLQPIVSKYSTNLQIIYLRTQITGLSRARNLGLQYAHGDIVSFPDDDCWYAADILQYVADYLIKHPELDGIAGRFTNERGEIEGRWLARCATITKYNVWNAAISFSIFLRSNVISTVGQFNENLGVGAGTPWGAGEETDYLLRSLKYGFHLRYLPTLILYHPVKTLGFDTSARARQQKYEAGIAHVIKINEYPFWYFPMICIRTTLGAFIAFLTGDPVKARFKWCSMIARIRAWHT